MNINSSLPQDMQGSVYGVTKNSAGEVLSELKKANMVVKGIRPVIVQMLAGSGYKDPAELPSIDTIKFGDSNTPPDLSDTGLKGNIIATKTIIGAAALSDSNRKATFSVLLGDTEAVDASIREAGLFSGDTLVARTTFGTYTKSSGTYFEFYWTIGYNA